MSQPHSDSHQGENALGRACATLRKRMGLTQRALAGLLGISEQAVGQWEGGKRSPSVEHLKRFLALGIQRQAFPSGQEYEEAQQLWLAARQPQPDFAAFWMQVQLASASARSAAPGLLVLKRGATARPAPKAAQLPALTWPRFDWGDALTVQALYGREAERLQLEQWVLPEHCQVVSVLGMGGIGKSALVVTFMHQVASSFEAVVFRSLRDGPPCQDLLASCLHVLSPEVLPIVPPGVEQGIDLLLACLQRRRCLLVLDNLETLLEAHNPAGHFRTGYEDYATLLERVAQAALQSCLLLTSREMPAALDHLESSQPSVRALRLAGLEPGACAQLLSDREVNGSTQDYERLAQRYDGNPLALNIVAESISDLFGGQISSFLQQDTAIFSSIRDLLAEQFSRLSALEQTLLFWLAVVREPVTIEELHALLEPPVDRTQVGEALEALQRRSLVERGKAEAENVGASAERSEARINPARPSPIDRPPERYTLHSVVLEYVTELLVEQVSEQIERGEWEYLVSYALEQATAQDYVRLAQERLIVAPILVRLQASSRRTDAVEVEEQLLRLLGELRTWDQQAQGYGPTNLIMLLRELRGHLRGLDLSQLAIRGAYLQGVEMQDATLSGASLRDTIFTETFDGITAVAISQSGQYWATASKRGEVRVWRDAGHTLHLVLQAHTDMAFALAFSPDERMLASGSLDGSIKLWEVERGTLLWLDWQTRGIDCLAFSPDGGLLASSGHEATIRLWDAKLGKPLEDLPHPGAVFALAWSSHGHLLASGDFAGTIRLWKRQQNGTARCVEILAGHSSWVRGLAFAPDGSILASASWDGTVKLWEVGEEGSLRARQALVGHTEKVQCVAWSPDGRTLASGSHDHTIRLWDSKEGSSWAVLQGHNATVYSLAFTPDSRHLLSGSDDGTLRLWDVQRGQCVRVLQGYAVRLFDLDWSPDGTRLASVGSDALVSIWQVESGKPSRVLRGHPWDVTGVAWRSDDRLLATSGWDNTIRLWDPASGSCLQILRNLDSRDTVFFSVAWSPDGKLLAGGTMLQGVLVWDVPTRSLQWAARTDSPRVLRLAWNPDGTQVAGGDEEGHVYVWEASEGKLLRRLEGHHGAITSVAFSPDGSRMASGSSSKDSGELLVWDASSGAGLYTFLEHPEVVTALSWAASGEVVVSGGSDGRLRWWEVDSGRCGRVQEAHQGTVRALKLSPDRSTLASCGDDGAIRLWDLESGQHLRTLRCDRPYERLTITGIRGLTEAQKATLRALGAIEDPAETSS